MQEELPMASVKFFFFCLKPAYLCSGCICEPVSVLCLIVVQNRLRDAATASVSRFLSFVCTLTNGFLSMATAPWTATAPSTTRRLQRGRRQRHNVGTTLARQRRRRWRRRRAVDGAVDGDGAVDNKTAATWKKTTARRQHGCD